MHRMLIVDALPHFWVDRVQTSWTICSAMYFETGRAQLRQAALKRYVVHRCPIQLVAILTRSVRQSHEGTNCLSWCPVGDYPAYLKFSMIIQRLSGMNSCEVWHLSVIGGWKDRDRPKEWQREETVRIANGTLWLKIHCIVEKCECVI